MNDKNTFEYSKRQGERGLKPHENKVEASSTLVSESSVPPMIEMPSAYSKRDGVLSVDIICVISGGTDREREFLNELERKNTFNKLKVIFVSTPKREGGLTPMMMQKQFDKIHIDKKIDINGHEIELTEIDKVYMFTDVDHYERDLQNILSNQKDKELPIWIISNPCLEIWIYYCYRNDPDKDLVDVRNAKVSKRSSTLKNINGRFNKGGGLDPRKAFEHLEDGIAHSKEHYDEIVGVPILFATQMHIFAEDVVKRLGEEYYEWLKSRKISRLNYRPSSKTCTNT